MVIEWVEQVSRSAAPAPAPSRGKGAVTQLRLPSARPRARWSAAGLTARASPDEMDEPLCGRRTPGRRDGISTQPDCDCNPPRHPTRTPARPSPQTRASRAPEYPRERAGLRRWPAGVQRPKRVVPGEVVIRCQGPPGGEREAALGAGGFPENKKSPSRAEATWCLAAILRLTAARRWAYARPCYRSRAGHPSHS